MSKNYLERTLEFHKKYTEEILPLFQKEEEPYRASQEEELKVYRTVVLIVLLIIFAVIVLVTRGFLPKSPEYGFLRYLFCALTSIPIMLTLVFGFDCFNFKAEKEYKTKLKENYLASILNVFGNIKWYSSQNVIDDSELERSGLFPKFNERQVDDAYTGNYKGVNFKISEEKIFIQEEDKRNTITPALRFPMFRGCILVFDVNKKVHNRTIVATRGSMIIKNSHLSFFVPFFCTIPFALVFFFALYDTLGIKGLVIDSVFVALTVIFLAIQTKLHTGEKMDKMQLEDLKFGGMFATYSSDQIEGRFLITPAFMERLLNLKTVFGTEKLKCSFYDDKLMIAIETKQDLFEIGDLHISLKDPQQINAFYNEISSILRMVEYFKLDEKIGL